jgi:uncharacterized protein (UPF0276 family)
METVKTAVAASPIPACAGIGLRAPHYRELLDRLPATGWLEAHSENYFADGGESHFYLERLRATYPLSLHGVGLSLGSTDELNARHLTRLKRLIERYQPALVSEHLSWSSVDGEFLNDLLPLPYTEEALAHICLRVGQVQDLLGRQILIENISSYLRFADSTIPEWEFLSAVAATTGCGILLDVNNIHVNAVNHGYDAVTFIDAVPPDAVQEVHLAGFEQRGTLLVDTHGAPVSAPVWELYRHTIERFGRVPTLIEWDTDIPALDVLLAEAARADVILEQTHELAA